ncbi:MAG: hypothetical protein JF614_11805 [Acidobacteria bacterium]|nr:hypothetical protein [Acidobacteriota bacterium]
MAEAADNKLHSDSRPILWLVSYELAPAFFDLGADEQYQLEMSDGAHAIALAFEHAWKAGYIATDFKKSWILLDLGHQADQAAAEKAIRGYPLHKYFNNLTYTRVFSATRGGFDPKIIWSGFKEFAKSRL